MWTLHVEEEFSSSHANGPDGHKCNNMHGHDWLALIEITYYTVDDSGWGPDFGLIKSIIKPLDHNNLNELFDGLHVDPMGFHYPKMKPSAENISQWLYGRVAQLVGRMPDFVTIREGGMNQVTYRD